MRALVYPDEDFMGAPNRRPSLRCFASLAGFGGGTVDQDAAREIAELKDTVMALCEVVAVLIGSPDEARAVEHVLLMPPRMRHGIEAIKSAAMQRRRKS